MRRVVCLALLGAGCFDFDHLTRNYGRDLSASDDLSVGDDLGLHDLSANSDLTGADLADHDLGAGVDAMLDQAVPGADLTFVPNDLSQRPPSDLALCNVTLPSAAMVLFVDETSNNAMGTQTHPYVTVKQAADAVNGSSAIDFAILIAKGQYPAAVSLSTKKVSVYGGYYSDFGCRDYRIDATTVRSDTNLLAAFSNTPGGDLTLDGLTVIGRTPTASAEIGVALYSNHGSITLRNSQAFSHDGAAASGSVVRAIDSDNGATILLYNSFVEGRAPALQAIRLCTSYLTARDSVIRSFGDATAGVLYTAGCGAAGVSPQVSVFRSLVEVAGANSLGLNDLISADSTAAAAHLERSVVIARGAGSRALRFDYPLSLVLRGNTFSAEVPLALLGADPLTHSVLDLRDNLFAGAPAMEMDQAPSGASFWDKNLFSPIAEDSLLFDFGVDGKWTRQQVEMAEMAAYGNPQFADPLLAADGIHLQSNSPARDHATTCWGTESSMYLFDFEGQASQFGGSCDIGGDEYAP